MVVAEAIFGCMHPNPDNNTQYFIQRSKSGHPAVLLVCHQARRECLPLFQRIGGELVCTGRDPIKVSMHTPRLYFNPSCDTLYSQLFHKSNQTFMGPMFRHHTWLHPCNRVFELPGGEDLPYIRTLSSIALDVADLDISPAGPGSLRFSNPKKLGPMRLKMFLLKYRSLREIILVATITKVAGSIGGGYELVEAGTSLTEQEE